MILAIPIFLITLLVLVVSHEGGHFFAAKKFGIKVLEFGFGIPPRAWGKKIGGTLVSINWLPLGGFVRLFGEDEVDKKVLREKDSFASKSVWQRMAVVVAGVSMNLILAWILFYTVLIFQDFKIIYPMMDSTATVEEVEKGSPADVSGIKPGERILTIDNKQISGIEDVINNVKDKAGVLVTMKLSDLDGKNQREVKVIPKEAAPGQARIGVALSGIPLKQYSTPLEKIFSAPLYSWDLTRITFAGLGGLIQDVFRQDFHKASQQVAGPVGLAVMTGNIISTGAVLFYIWFSGVLSLTLAIINILPFPALDGGRLAFLAIEAVTRKRVRPEVERLVHSIGMAILLGLVALITFSDIKKFF